MYTVTGIKMHVRNNTVSCMGLWLWWYLSLLVHWVLIFSHTQFGCDGLNQDDSRCIEVAIQLVPFRYGEYQVTILAIAS